MSEARKKAAPTPHFVALEQGKSYAWCTCGLSKSMPFCDGAHVGTAFEPMEFTARKSETVMLCGCSETGDPPYCDGTHDVL